MNAEIAILSITALGIFVVMVANHLTGKRHNAVIAAEKKQHDAIMAAEKKQHDAVMAAEEKRHDTVMEKYIVNMLAEEKRHNAVMEQNHIQHAQDFVMRFNKI